jgi:isocitrate dehydrogenase (NAD+)
MAEDVIRVVVLEGDETGQELLDQAVRVLDPSILELELELQRFDLSLENRRATSNDVVSEAAAAMRPSRLRARRTSDRPTGFSAKRSTAR